MLTNVYGGITFYRRDNMHAEQKPFVKRQSGFVLVVALSMMAFVLMLLVSITLLIQVETTNASRALDQLRARENARLGLMVGLGKLQKFAICLKVSVVFSTNQTAVAIGIKGAFDI